MRRVVQKNEFDCGVAALAMALGKRYSNIDLKPKKRGRKLGLSTIDMMMFLESSCIEEVQDITIKTFAARKPKPFADRHLVLVRLNKTYHWVVMDRKGNVLDPDPKSKGIRTLKDYPKTMLAIGLE